MKTRRIFWPLMAILVLSCGKAVIEETPEIEVVPKEEVTMLDPWTLVPQEFQTAQGDALPVVAGFDDTKSQLQLDASGNSADVIWSAGDTFRLFMFTDEGRYSAYYTTSLGGVNAEFETTYGIPSSVNEFVALYPSDAIHAAGTFTENTTGIKHNAYGLTLPAVQTATTGSVAEGCNLSYAHPANLDNKLGFRNLVSLVKFRLSGSIVSQVKSVTLRGISPIAGDYVLFTPNGEPEWVPDVHFSGHTDTSRSVKLTGDFAPDTDYYIALIPCHQEGFSMIFANADGSATTTITSTGPMDFERSGILDFGTIKLGKSFMDTPSLAAIKYKEATQTFNGFKPFSVVVIPDGYTEAELPDFVMQAKAGINTLFSVEPYKTYASYFNVWILQVASAESGASVTDGNSNVTTPVNNAFGSKWGPGYSDMAADEDAVFSFVEAHCPDIVDGSHTINEVPVLMIINDDRYGGIARFDSDGMVYCMVPTTSGGLSWGYPDKRANTDARISEITTSNWGNYVIDTPADELTEVGVNSGTWVNTLVHEFGGHSVGRLGDEYWYEDTYKSPVTYISAHNWTAPYRLNISATPDENSVPWAIFMEHRAELTAQTNQYRNQYARIGIFQGGDVSMFNRWRSEKVSCMIDNRLYFSAWQRYVIVKRICTMTGKPMISFEEFLANDKPLDPVRDMGSSQVRGVSNAAPPRLVPMLPPPVEEHWD